MRQEIPIEKLIVNPENYRFDPVDDQNQAINLMIKKKGQEILVLAKHILEFGLDNAKDIRVLQQGESYLVLDGNRRITAVKCLINPSLINNDKLKKEFEQLPSLFSKKPPQAINCFVYTDEKDASEWIRLDHTGKNNGAGQDSWGAQETDRFKFKFGDKLSPAMQILDLLQSKGYSFDTNRLKISTVNRILAYPSLRSYLGIDIKQNNIKIVGKEDDAIIRLNALFTNIIDNDVKVASVYDKDKALVFIKNLFGEPLKNELQTAMKLEPEKVSDNPPTPTKKLIGEQELDQNKDSVEQNPKMFVIMAFAGLKNAYDAIEKVSAKLFKNMDVYRIDYSSGAKTTQDEKIIRALETSSFLIVVLSMGEKERMAYEAIKKSGNAKEILEKYFPINHNVLLEFGYGLKCVRGTRKEKDIFIILEDIEDNGLPNLKDFCRNNFFDIRNRDQVTYKTIDELEKGLERAFKYSESMKQYLK